MSALLSSQTNAHKLLSQGDYEAALDILEQILILQKSGDDHEGMLETMACMSLALENVDEEDDVTASPSHQPRDDPICNISKVLPLPETFPLGSVLEAKRHLAPDHPASDWTSPSPADFFVQHSSPSSLILNGRVFEDNVPRSTLPEIQELLPDYPCVFTCVCEGWSCAPKADSSCPWSSDNLASRFTASDSASDFFSVDGGPPFARQSLAQGLISMDEYATYSRNDSAGDSAPLYIFDPHLLDRTFSDGTLMRSEFTIPSPFMKDTMACITGSQYRPLPPAWLLVGSMRSGTSIHNHPLTVAWNALLCGCKIWCLFEEDVEVEVLLLDLEEDYDLSALDWFMSWSGSSAAKEESSSSEKRPSSSLPFLPSFAKLIIQKPGETVYVPTGFYHVVLNVEPSTALSHSLSLERDFDRVWPLLKEDDPEFAEFWRRRRREEAGER